MGAFKLGKMTFGSLFKKPETIVYPFQVKPQPPGLKGRIRIDAEACILCGMCERSCTTNCLEVDKQARTWKINAFACVQCGYCVTVCPKNCLYMEPDYHPAAAAMSADVIPVPAQAEQPKAEEQAAEPAKASTAPQPAPASADTARDDKLEELITLMDPDKRARVKAALGQ